jgi:RNA polymerase sigma-70 factor (ECF subfamily)
MQLRLQSAPGPLPDEEGPEEADLVAQQLRRALESIQGEFEGRTWQAFWQVQMDGRTTEEVGAALGMTPAAVRKAKFRVLRRLREEMGELME